MELVAFNFHFPKIPKAFIFLISGPSGHVHDPRNQLLLTLALHTYFREYKKIQKIFRGIFVCEMPESWKSERLKKKTCREILKVPSYQILKLLNMGSKSAKNMKSKFGIFQINWRNLNNWNLVFYVLLKEFHPHQPIPIRTLIFFL